MVSINGTIGKVAFYNNEKIILGKSACYFNLLGCINKVYVKCIIETEYFSEYAKKENLFKNLFERSRVADTELYSLDLEQVIQLLSSFEGTQIFPKGETKQEVFEKTYRKEE